MTVVFDTSLTQKIVSLGPWNSAASLYNLHNLSSLLGNLSGVVFLDAKDDIVLERLEKRKRNRVNIAHRGLSDHALTMETKKRLESARQLADTLENKGVSVIRVNAGDQLDEQVKFVGAKLSQIVI